MLATAIITAAVVLLCPASALGFGPVSSHGSFGSGAGQMKPAVHLTIGPDGSSYVADSGNNRIDVFSPQGAFLRALGQGVNPIGPGNLCTTATGCVAGVGGSGAGGMESADGIAIAPNGNLYVSSRQFNRINVFSPQGDFLFGFGDEVNLADGSDLCTLQSGCQEGANGGGAGALGAPQGIVLGSDGKLYVASESNNRIDVFSLQGAFLFAFGRGVNQQDLSDVCTQASGCQRGQGTGGAGELRGPTDVALAPGPRIAVANRGANRIDVFSPQGTFLYGFGKGVSIASPGDVCTVISGCRIGAADSSAGALNLPRIVDVDAAGTVYVGDERNPRVSQFQIAGTFVRAFGEGVVSGAEAFQICDVLSGCLSGVVGQIPGAVSIADDVAIDCRGAVLVTETAASFARVERFAEASTPPPPCPPTSTPPPPGRPADHLQLGKLRLNKKRGTASLDVVVSGPGKLVLAGRGLRKVTRNAKRAGRVRLPIRLVGRASRRLNGVGVATVRARIIFTPASGAPLTKQRRLTLRMAPRR